MESKGKEFKGLLGGANYERFAALFGMGAGYYRKCLGGLGIEREQKALDLGCGPGGLCFALAEKAGPEASICGIDISEDQLTYARSRAADFRCGLEFLKASMDELPFPDGSFDLVMTSMALHAAPPEVRRRAVAETSRVLKKGGTFLLVDWSKPRFGLLGLVWLPFLVRGETNKDNWNNVYPDICRREGLLLEQDDYISSIARRQVFRKGERTE